MRGDALGLLALTGLLAALPPLIYVYFSRGADRYARLAGVTAFLAFDLILFGAFTRLTDSGLGCPDWPGCYGEANPLAARGDIAAAESLLPDGPVTWMKAWIEMLHRFFAMGLGLVITILMVWAWRRRGRGEAAWSESARAGLATAVFAMVCLQGAFGAYTVTLKLMPAVVTLHLLGGMVLLAMLVRLSRPGPAVRPLRGLTLLALAALLVQIGLGGWVSSNYAVLACPDAPLCHGAWLPEMAFRDAFTFWRPLGETGDGQLLPQAALTAIHWTHRLGAVVLALLLAGLIWRARAAGEGRWAAQAGLLLVVQLGTGLANVVWHWPLALALLHNGGAALLVMVLTARLTGPAKR